MNQQEEEKLVFEYVRKNLEDFPKGKVIKSESPDFIVKLSRKESIGIELTRLVEDNTSLIENIKISLAKKTEKLKLYQKGIFKEIWLIIYADSLIGKKSYNIHNLLSNNSFPSSYSRVFVLDLFKSNVYELKD